MPTDQYRDRSADFALQEHSELRAEIRDQLREARSLERNILIAIGVVWAFLASHPIHDRWPWWFPVLLAALGSYRSYALHKIFRQQAKYLLRIEVLLANPDNGGANGWEHFLVNEPRAWTLTTLIYWALILIATIIVALLKGV